MNALDRYFDELDTQQQTKADLNRSLAPAIVQNPEEYARAVRLQGLTGIDAGLLVNDPETRKAAEARATMGRLNLDGLIRANPKTAAFLSDPNNAGYSHDDAEGLSVIEQVLRQGADVLRSVPAGAVKGAGSVVSGASNLLDISARAIDRPIRSAFGEKVANAFWYEPGKIETPFGPLSADPFYNLKGSGQYVKRLGSDVAAPQQRQNLATDVAEGVGQLGFQIAQFMATGGAGTVASMYAQGVDVMADKTAKDQAPQANKDVAMLAGGSITALTEKYGLDKILNRVPPAIKNRTLRFLADSAAAGGIEASQEIAEGLLHDVSRYFLTNDNPSEIGQGFSREATAAGLSAAIVRAALGVRGHRQAQQDQAFFEALGDATKNSKTLQRLPERAREVIAALQGEGQQSVYVDARQALAYFQSAQVDPATMPGAEQLQEAAALGGDWVVPMADFAANIAPTDHLQGLMEDLKLRPGDLSPRELRLAEANTSADDKQLAAMVEQAQRQIEADASAQSIYQDLYGQAIGTGATPSTAEAWATLTAAHYRTRAQRLGIDAAQLWQDEGLTVTRPLPAILGNRQSADPQFDSRLDMIRAGKGPGDAEMFGPSLTQFIRQKGGINDEGGELSSRDADADRAPFVRKLIQESGLSIDGARELAAEAGYPVGETEAEFLDAMDADLRGGDVYSALQESADAIGLGEELRLIASALDELGIDAASLTNEQVRARLNQAANEPEGNSYAQSGQTSFADFVADYITSRPVDAYTYKQNLESLIEEIENDWSNGSSDDYSGRFGPDEIHDALHSENEAEYYDEDGDLTDSGSKRYNEAERALSEKIAREELGEPQPEEVHPSRPNDMAKMLHAYLEQAGFDVYAISGSAKSDSKYFDVVVDDERRKVRVADHALPPEYGDANGAADYELSLYDVGDDLRADGRMASDVISDEEAIVRAQALIDSIRSDAADPASPNILYQSATAPRMLAVHNLSADNLIFADKMGGLAVPSVGVVTEQSGSVDGFGEITLIGTKSLVDPKQERVFSSDAYTARFPAPEWPKAKSKDAQKLVDEIRETSKEFDDRSIIDHTWDNMIQTPDAGEVVSRWLQSNTIKALYLREQGVDALPALRPIAQSTPVPAERLAELAPLVAAVDQSQGYDATVASPEWAALASAYKQIIVEKYAAKGREVTDTLAEFGYGTLAKLERDIKNAGKDQVDGWETSKQLDEQIDKRAVEFKQWVEAKVLPNFGEPFIKVAGKKAPYTLHNIVEVMTDAKVRGKEKTMTYGPGQVRAAASIEFSDLEQMRKHAEESVADKDEYEAAKEQSEKELATYRDAVVNFTKITNWKGQPDIWEAMDGSMRALAKWATGKKRDAASLKAALRAEDFDVAKIPAGVIERGMVAGNALMNSPVPYFEAKPQRSVGLDEFAGAVIPKNAPQAVRDILAKHGIEVTEYDGEESRGAIAKDFAAQLAERGAETLFQKERDGKNAAYYPGTRTITLLEKANPSSFFHELGHHYLEGLRRDALRPDAPQQVKDDWAKAAKWMNIDPAGAIPVDAHEQWARGTELYMAEGRAPAFELRELFRRAAAFIKLVYRDLTRLNVTLTDEVRGVMDRLIATDEEIAQAENAQQYEPIFADAKAAGVTEAEWNALQEIRQQARATAEQQAVGEVMRELKREQTKWWAQAMETMRAEVTKEAQQVPAYQALHAMTRDEFFDGRKPETPLKLSREALVSMYGEPYLKRLSAQTLRTHGWIYAKEGGMHPDAVAPIFGFDSGDAMIKAIVEAPPIKQWIEAETKQRMLDVHGDMLNDGGLADEAMAAVHNDRQADVLLAELRILNRKAGGGDLTQQAIYRDIARREIGKRRIDAIAPDYYLRAERKAGKEAFDAAAKQDFKAAAEAKQRQLLNLEFYRAARDGREEIDKAVAHLKGLSKSKARSRIGKAGQEWLAQLDGILERYSFAPMSLTSKARSLAEWYATINDPDGLNAGVAIAPSVLDDARRQNYREMTLDELRAVADSVASIEHVAKKITQVLKNGKAFEFDEMVGQLVAAIHASPLKDIPILAPGDEPSLADKFRALTNTNYRPETLMELLDNATGGIFHDLFWTPASVAQVKADTLKRDVLLPLQDLITDLPKDHEARLAEQVAIPGLGRSLRRYQLIGIALNVGNDGNKHRLQKGGLRFPDGTATEVDDALLANLLAPLSQSDWQMVQRIWDTIGQLYAPLNELNKTVTGLPLAKVDAAPIQTAHGTFAGGYWPAVADPLYSELGKKQENESTSAADFFPSPFANAATAHSFRKERTNASYPLLFDWRRILSRHVNNATTDIAYAEFVAQAGRLLRNKDIQLALTHKLGDQQYRGLLEWLSYQVRSPLNGNAGNAPIHDLMQMATANTAVAALGFKVATAFGNAVVAPVQALGEVKGRYMAQGYVEFLASPEKAMEKVRALSGEMRFRSQHLDATFTQVMDYLAGKPDLRRSIMHHSMQIHTVADIIGTTGLWLGKYQQEYDRLAAGAKDQYALDEASNEAVRLADKMIRTTQTAGAAKDLSAFERDQSMGMFKLFLGPMIILQNGLRKAVVTKQNRIIKLFASIILPSVLFELAVGRGPDDDEDEAAWALRKIALAPLQMVPFVRDAANLLESLITGKPGFIRSNPITDLGAQAVRAYKAIASDNRDAGDKVAAAVSLSGLIGMPSGAVATATNYTVDLLTGETDIHSPLDVRYLFIKRDTDRND